MCVCVCVLLCVSPVSPRLLRLLRLPLQGKRASCFTQLMPHSVRFTSPSEWLRSLRLVPGRVPGQCALAARRALSVLSGEEESG